MMHHLERKLKLKIEIENERKVGYKTWKKNGYIQGGCFA